MICFHLAPTSTSHLCTSASRFPACGECVLWLLHQCSPPASLQNPSSRIMLWTPFASDAPNAAAYSSASALFFAMAFCYRESAFRVCLPGTSTPALDDFRVSLQAAQPESVNTISSSALFPSSNTCPNFLSRFRYLASLFNLARLCWLGLLRNKHLATCDRYC